MSSAAGLAAFSSALLEDYKREWRPGVRRPTPLMDRLSAEVERVELATGALPREIELSPKLWHQLQRELGPIYRATVIADLEGRGYFLGAPVRKGTTSWACRSCGAPREESRRCSYCLQPYDRITIDGEIAQ